MYHFPLKYMCRQPIGATFGDRQLRFADMAVADAVGELVVEDGGYHGPGAALFTGTPTNQVVSFWAYVFTWNAPLCIPLIMPAMIVMN